MANPERISSQAISLAVERFARMAPRRGLLTPEQVAERDRDEYGAREQRLERIRRSGIGKRLGRDQHGRSDVDRIIKGDMLDTSALRAVQHLAGTSVPVQRERRWLMLCGDTGIGKSVAAGWLLARDGGRYVTIHDLAEQHSALARGLAPQTQDEIRERLNRVIRGKVVVLDELGQEEIPMALATRRALHWFVERRIASQPPDSFTVIISNLNEHDLRDRFNGNGAHAYDRRTARRLATVCMRKTNQSCIHEIGGPDMRGAPL